MKNICYLMLFVAVLSCKKKEPVTETPPTDPKTGMPYNVYDFRISGLPDTSIVLINGKTAVTSNYKNRPNYVLNAGDEISVYYSYKADKTKLGPKLKPGQNKDSLILYYTQHPDSNFNTCHNSFSIWQETYPVKYVFPKYRIIISGTDTFYKHYIKGSIKY